MLYIRAILLSGVLIAAAHAQPIPTDPALVTGELENGLKYIVRQHNNPPGKTAMWIHIHSGSLNETDNQRGIAHYLEHMAFNGSEAFPPASLIPFFQSMGMTFGRDQNAFTNMHETTYQLYLPDTKPETIGKGFTFFSDVVDKLSLLPKEIESERQIIQEERRRSLGAQERTRNFVLEHLAPGSVYGGRNTIGLERTINSVQEKDFREYYTKWYAASNATLIIVADTDPKSVVPIIKEKFSSAAKRPRPAPQDIGVKAYTKNFTIITSDVELRNEEVSILKVGPSKPATTTIPQVRADLVASLGQSAFNRRIDDKVARGGTNYLGINATRRNEVGGIYRTEVSARCSTGKWQTALDEMAIELQRARAFGFTAHEIDQGRKQILSGAERAVETEGTMPASAVIGRINGNVGSGTPITTAQQNLELVRQILPTITVDEINKRFADEFNPDTVAFVAILTGNSKIPTDAELLAAGAKALAVKPTQDTEQTHATTLMAELPKGGKVAESSEHAASQVWSGWLTNNARVHYKFNDFNKNNVTVSVSLIGGELLETAANRGITTAANLAISGNTRATKHLTSTDIRELMTGKKIMVGGGGGGGGRGGGGGGRGGGGGGVGNDGLGLAAIGSPEDLETGLQLMHLLLTEPKIDAVAFDQWKTRTRENIVEQSRNPVQLGGRLSSQVLYPEDEVRTQPLTVEQLDKITIEDAQAWLDKLIKNSPIEVAICGDISKDKALELVSRYIGSLPIRNRVSATMHADLRKLKRPEGPRVVEKTIETPTLQGYVFSGFYGADDSNVDDVRALSMASRIMSTRMTKEIREEAQLVYSMGASSRPATTYPGFGVFSASAPTEPGKVPALVAKIESMYEKFAKDGVTAEELDTAKKQMAVTWEDQMKQPTFWLGRMNQMTFRGANLDDTIGAPAAYQAMTAKQVQEAFAKYYSKKNSIVVTVKPTEVEKKTN